jgi:sugar lactone lactonase YvrE
MVVTRGVLVGMFCAAGCGSVITPQNQGDASMMAADAAVDGAPGGADAAIPPFSAVWIPHYGLNEVRKYVAARAVVDGPGATADVAVTLPAGCKPNAVAFDLQEDLWVACNNSNQLVEIDASGLAATGTPTPKTVVDSDGTSLFGPIGLLFDGDGNLWVSCDDRLELFAPATLATSGAKAPDRVITTAAFDLPAGMIFDSEGNLWVANASFTTASNSIMAFTAAQVGAGGAQTPRLVITSAAFDLVEGLAFDAGANLWVASNDAGIAKFSAAQVVLPATPGSVVLTPALQLEESADVRTVRDSGAIRFDDQGNLYVVSQLGDAAGNDARFLRFSAGQLAPLTDDTPLAADAVLSDAASSPGYGGFAFYY